MLKLSDIISDPAIELVAGNSRSVSRPVRWVHVSEHEDPGPWISGGELVLTTGYNLSDETRQREFIRRLAENDVAGLGFGVGFDHKEVPTAMVDASEELDIPLIRVSYDLPFIEIIENASLRLIDEQHEALKRSRKIQAQLERELIDGAGLDRILNILTIETQGSAVVFDRSGKLVSAGGASFPGLDALSRELENRLKEGRVSYFSPEATGEASIALPIPGPVSTHGTGWLAYVSPSGGSLSRFESLLVRSCSTVCGLHQMKRDAVLSAERKLTTDLLDQAVEGNSNPRETARRLSSLGITGEIVVYAFDLDDPDSGRDSLESFVVAGPLTALVMLRVSARCRRLCVVAEAKAEAAEPLAQRMLEALSESGLKARVGMSRSHPPENLVRAFHEARSSVEAASNSKNRPAVSTPADLGAMSLLFALNDEEALRTFAASVLDPIGDPADPLTKELLTSLEVFIDCNGSWAKASTRLYCHRHTLRHRITRIEEKTGRNFELASDRIDCWVAIQALRIINDG